MNFTFNEAAECLDIKFEQVTGESSVEIKYIQFNETSKKKIEDIFKNGVSDNNDKLEVNQILLSKDNYLKLENCKYKASFRTLANFDEGVIQAIEFTLGNIALNFEMKNVSFEGDDVKINLAEITVYPSDENSIMDL